MLRARRRSQTEVVLLEGEGCLSRRPRRCFQVTSSRTRTSLQSIHYDYRTSTSIMTHRPRSVSYRPNSVSVRKCASSKSTSIETGGFAALCALPGLASGALCLRLQNKDLAAGGGVDLSGSGSITVGAESDIATSSCVFSSSIACCCIQNSSVSCRPSSCMRTGVSSAGNPTSWPLRLAAA